MNSNDALPKKKVSWRFPVKRLPGFLKFRDRHLCIPFFRWLLFGVIFFSTSLTVAGEAELTNIVIKSARYDLVHHQFQILIAGRRWWHPTQTNDKKAMEDDADEHRSNLDNHHPVSGGDRLDFRTMAIDGHSDLLTRMRPAGKHPQTVYKGGNYGFRNRMSKVSRITP